MSKKLYEESNIQDIADAIREKNGEETAYKVSEMANTIRAIRTQPVLESLSVSQNGTYNPPSGVDGYAPVTVNVSGSPVLQSKTATTNGTVTADSGYDGLSSVTVAVASIDPPRPALPSEYQEVEYVGFDGASGFNVIVPSVYTIVVDAEQAALNTTSMILGYRNEYSADVDFNFGSTGGEQRWFQRVGAINAGKITLNDKRVRSRAVIGLLTLTTLCVGKYYIHRFDQAFRGKFYKLALLNSATNTWLKYFVPCYRISDSVIGFYDVVGNTFYTNTGTGAFTKGPDVN